MHHNLLLRITASGLALTGTIGCAPLSSNFQAGTLVTPAADAVRDEAKLYASAHQAVRAGRYAEALGTAETLVGTAQRDAGYRILLGDLYIKNGRFASAEAAFADVLRLDPTSTRASLSLALAQIAQGKAVQAEAELDKISRSAQPGDLGLAYALAGRTERAIALLEDAARAPGADGRVRQNLALAYAIAGEWGKARVTASQDIDSAELAKRLADWADLANPAHADSRVARLLGVPAAQDPGLPVQLALRDEVPVVLAQEAPPPVVAAVPAAQPVELAGYPAPIVAAPVEARVAAAAAMLVKAEPAVIKAPVAIATTPLPAFTPKPSQPSVPFRVGSGRYVVQIGAYQNGSQAQQAWGRAARRFALDGGMKPHSTVVTLPGKGKFHRLSVAGFEGRQEAARLCRSIRAKGGACFVRLRAGDSLAAWAGGGASRG